MHPRWTGLVLCILPLVLAAALGRRAEPRRQEAAPLSGTWEGTSVCLVNRGLCRDEHVVYHLAPAAPAADSARLTIAMNKVVSGREEEMAMVRCRTGDGEGTLTCPMPPRFRPGTWSFALHGNVLSGLLTAPDGVHLRRISVRRRG
jgi:hypothetical protein